MQKVYVLGHKNPDTDAVCAPYTYAWLKNSLDSSRRYIAGVLGTLNPQTRYIFDKLGVEAPEYIRDVLPKAEDVMLRDMLTILETEPIGLATQVIDVRKVRTIPLVNEAGEYRGLVSIQELAHYFMPKHYEVRPLYHLRPENFCEVLPGEFLKKGVARDIEAPLMVGAMQFDTFIRRLQESLEVLGTKLPVMIVGNRPDIIEYCLKQSFPILILTGMSDEECTSLDIGGFEGWIYISKVDTAETIRLLRTSIPANAIANKNLPVLAPTDYLSDVKRIMASIDHNGVAVVQDNILRGLITSSCLIDPPKHQVIMVDHNEFSQSVEGIEQAEVIEILDHHRLGSIRTTKPIYVYARPLGSSCTLVYQHYQIHDMEPPPEIAALMLSGILTDTVILRSPTTTPEDILAAETLARIAGLDIATWGKEIFGQAESLAGSDPDTAVQTDFKLYQEHGQRVGIAQMEVITLSDLKQTRECYLEALERARQKYSLDWAMLLITDIISETSILLCTSSPDLEAKLLYQRMDANTYHLPGILSRKKQLLPEILRVLESRG
ncbi:MAG: putative manganese-dependent inorganic diphosphatase [Candidatus Cloacimonadaceae bacterium]|nr:putative manganese-dependent inorganic diphosphatase [Candidatus Cloacimonadaceae bacterium]